MPKGSKVLMADDDKMLLDMYKERLELAGYEVQSYSNGEEALPHVRDFVPDIIMLDVMMPKMNGYETLASLKSDPTTKDIPVVMLSALMRDFNREKAVEGGAEDYLIKSEAMPSDVITKIEQVLQKFGKGSSSVPGAQATISTPSTPSANVGTTFATPPAEVQIQPVVFTPAAPETLRTEAPTSPTTGQESINTQPEIVTPKMTEEPTIVTPIGKAETAVSVKSGGWIKPVIIVLLILVVVTILYYFLVIRK